MKADSCDKISSREVKDRIDYKVIGKHMRNIRKENRLTQSAIANIMGVSVNFYAALECGTNKTNLPRIIQFADITNVNIDRIVAGAYHDSSQRDSNSSSITEVRKAFNQLLDECSDQVIIGLYETCCTITKHFDE